jgi:hypothetical protein
VNQEKREGGDLIRPAEVARRRLLSSRLIVPSTDAPEEVVRRHGAMQAQDYAPAKWSVGQRASGIVDEDVDRAVAAGAIIRTHVLRPTWHFVARDDIRWLLALTGPRVHQHNTSRYRELELEDRTLARCQKLIVSELEGGKRLRRDEIADLLDHEGIDHVGQRLPYILMHCELEAAICSGGFEGRVHTYALLDERVPGDHRFDRDEASVELTRRYLTSHGPATVKDLRWWSSLTVADIKSALHMLGTEVQSETIDDITFWSMTVDQGATPKPRGARLLQPFDEFIVGYTESRFFGDPRATESRAAWGDRTLPRGLVLLNGNVAGRWRRTIHKEWVKVEALTYEEPKPSAIHALEAAAADLGRFGGLRATAEIAQL